MPHQRRASPDFPTLLSLGPWTSASPGWQTCAGRHPFSYPAFRGYPISVAAIHRAGRVSRGLRILGGDRLTCAATLWATDCRRRGGGDGAERVVLPGVPSNDGIGRAPHALGHCISCNRTSTIEYKINVMGAASVTRVWLMQAMAQWMCDCSAVAGVTPVNQSDCVTTLRPESSKISCGDHPTSNECPPTLALELFKAVMIAERLCRLLPCLLRLRYQHRMR